MVVGVYIIQTVRFIEIVQESIYIIKTGSLRYIADYEEREDANAVCRNAGPAIVSCAVYPVIPRKS